MKKKKNILVGVCGGIAAYKSCSLVSLLVKRGCAVKVLMTPAAAGFVTPLTFQTLSGNAVYMDMMAPVKDPRGVEHISLADWADAAVVAPLSANTLSKIAHGICDNLLTAVICALPQKTGLVLAPAMNDRMWSNPIIAANTQKLKAVANYRIVPPQKGRLACGAYGCGRMAEPELILKAVLR